ncbi:MAG: LON peptidase substrate-binding domain-containing protein [Pseudanabaenaceae cyanobacterium SKYGB_i_bin29]|nr:LON peptidase substrate-binding domain-containing protein [Pseudanabaenaceae cyanobacterium SKYG29]MDW8420314.1 LON peptidase substrate-binding domain-containing protein [Pseudanabaenaceae cyanobacterium SKYGB_i_bin29]
MTVSSLSVRELPLFPLPEVVLFPGQALPLHIFEYRYRMMINTVMETDRSFGVLMWDSQGGKCAMVGCCAQIVQYHKLPDDRWKIMTIGQQRFRVLKFTREKPYRVGLVEWIDDHTCEDTDLLYNLAEELRQVLMDVVRLSQKLTEQEIELPQIPRSPLELSYWIASYFYGASEEQQALLETQDTIARLRREVDILSSTRSQLAARTVLKETLKDI